MLPYFNPDKDREPLPDTVISLRQQIKAGDGIIISSPEYAHGVPGSLKNALDWLVRKNCCRAKIITASKNGNY